MDENTVREHAQRHADATVEGDFKTAGRALTPEAAAQAQDVMKAMPSDLNACEITSIDKDGDNYVAVIAYRGPAAETKVESIWAEREGRPRIVNLKSL